MRLPAALAEPRNPGKAIAIGWLLAFPPSIFLAMLADWLLPAAQRPEFGVIGLGSLAMLVLFAPLVETLIMAAAIELMLRLRIPPLAAVLLSSAGWGIAHSLAAPVWGLIIWWPFLIFSTLYVTWRERSVAAALGIVFAVHALQNLGPSLLLLYEAA